jgi:hypothetical protein
MDISINKITNEIKKGTLSKNFRTGDWENCLNEDGSIKTEFKSIINTHDFNKIKEVKLLNLQKIRNNSFASQVAHSKGEFSATEGAYTKLAALVSSWNGSTQELWRDVNNNMVSITKTEAKEILSLIKDAHTPLYGKEATVAKAIDNINTIEELENFDIQAAWEAA